MLMLLSPAKTVDENACRAGIPQAEPRLKEHTLELLQILKKKSVADVKKLMSVSDDIAKLNVGRYKDFEKLKAKQAVLLFDGVAFKGLKASEFSEGDLEFAHEHLRILSGFYGVVRALDMVKPYRLEMGTRLQTPRGKDLYSFWGDLITDQLRMDIASRPEEEKFIVNCASQEYFKSVRSSELPEGVKVLNMQFPAATVYAKAARGQMCRFIILNRIKHPDGLKEFKGTDGEWAFDEDASTDTNFVFVRTVGAKPRKAPATPARKTKRAKAV